MKKMARWFTIGLLVVATMIPAAASAGSEECGSLRGAARLELFDNPQNHGGLLGQGVAFVRFAGNWQRATFDETSFIPGSGGSPNLITHEWTFEEGTATFVESSTPRPLAGTDLVQFSSPVMVSPDGSARYNGVFNPDAGEAGVAWFRVSGNICVSH